MRRRSAYGIVALASVVPRLIVAAVERDDLVLHPLIIDTNFHFARTLMSSGTFGYTPGVPSADTQPLYGFFLTPLTWLFGASWLSIGLAQTMLAASTAILVYEIARLLFETRWALLAAVAATLNPYLVWHDPHVNREVLDACVAAGLVLLALLAMRSQSLRLAAVLGAIAGLAMLGNVRLAPLPLLLAGLLVWRADSRRRALFATVAVLVTAAIVISPWVVRNRLHVGCFALTTNSQALWKANNPNTYSVLASGGWIDDVPPIREPAGIVQELGGGGTRVDECARMRFYRERVLEFWREHPDQKARLAGQAFLMFWDPRARVYEVRGPEGEDLRPISVRVDFARTWVQGTFMVSVFILAAIGLFRVHRTFAVLALSLLTFQTVMAMVHTGTTRYRAPWDFLLVLLATAGVAFLSDRVRATASRFREDAPSRSLSAPVARR